MTGPVHTAPRAESFRICLAGNPNVGKSTVFNALTGLHQHTGNWPGKTVELAEGNFVSRSGRRFTVVDLPGTYSLLADSPEEAVARDYLCAAEPDAVVVVADATALERSLHLCLQICECCDRVILCVNLLDEAQKRGIGLSLPILSEKLGIPVVGTAARNRKGLHTLVETLEALCGRRCPVRPCLPTYPEAVGQALAASALPRFQALCLLSETMGAEIASAVTAAAHAAAEAATRTAGKPRGLRFDRVLMRRGVGLAAMSLLLAAVLWLTIAGANAPSAWLARMFAALDPPLRTLLDAVGFPPFWQGLLADGIFATTAQVVAVMLPPMAIFFPLFTLLEDAGLLPRIAFFADRTLARAGGHGKQALTMCMGLGCSACGVIGCRIIEAPKERAIAVVTNSLMPCNGKFPALIALCALLVGGQNSLLAALLLLLILMLAVGATLLVSKLLSTTLLRGEPSRFVLELPPYRRPQVGRVLVRSLCSRTLFVLGRAVSVAAPAGAVLWLLANVTVGGESLVLLAARSLDGVAAVFGLRGSMLLACLLAFPANELFLANFLAIEALMGNSGDLAAVFAAGGWGSAAPVCALLLVLFHAPCAATVWTIAKETRSIRLTALAVTVPAVLGLSLCLTVNLIF